MSRLMGLSLDAARLRQVLAYDPNAGTFHWRESRTSSGRLRARSGQPAGWVEPSGYVRITVDGRTFLAHRLAWLYVHGEWPGELDHINRDRADYRIANLREVTRSENMQNTGAHRDAACPYVGVSPAGERWSASICVDGKTHWLGRHDTPEQARDAYVAAAAELRSKESTCRD